MPIDSLLVPLFEQESENELMLAWSEFDYTYAILVRA